jgi:regulator of nucleoside diphosphate kinase
MINKKSFSINRTILLLIVLINAIVIREAYIGDKSLYLILLITLPLLALAIANNFFLLQNRITMRKSNNELVLRTDDYRLLISYLNGGNSKTAFDARNAEALHAELKRAKLVDKDDFPDDVVRINSTVQVKAEEMDDIMQFMLVTPDRANIKEKRVSVMAPIGTALIGFRKGQRVKWKVPAGEKTFTILDVINEE